MPYQAPSASQFTQIKRLQSTQNASATADPLKFRAPYPYSRVQPGVSAKFGRNVLASNKFLVEVEETGPFALSEWTPRDSARSWRSLGISANGRNIIAGTVQAVYTSSDFGVTWVPRITNGPEYWVVASSADGMKLAAAGYNDKIYISTNSGITWTPRAVNNPWNSISMSSDGNTIIASRDGQGPFYISKDTGITWTPNTDVNHFVKAVAVSGNGNVFVAVSFYTYISLNSGITWTYTQEPFFGGLARGVTSSADGTKLAVIAENGICTSIDSGLTWTLRETSRDWRSISSSADGTKIVAGVAGTDKIYISEDSGVTWNSYAGNRNWLAVAISANGRRLIGANNSEYLYTAAYVKI